MSARAEVLARRFEHAHEELLALAESLSDTQWRTHVPEEQCTIAALVRHVAVAYRFEIRAFTAIANGIPVAPLTWDALAQSNAQDAATHAACDRPDTLALLTRYAARAAATGHYLEGLPALTLDQWLRHVLVGHITSHLASIRSTLGFSTGEALDDTPATR